MQKEWGAERGLQGTWDHAETLSRAELGPRLSSLSPAPGPALPPAGTLGAECRRTTGIPSLFPKLRAPSGGLWLAQLGSGPQPRTVGGGHVGGVCKIASTPGAPHGDGGKKTHFSGEGGCYPQPHREPVPSTALFWQSSSLPGERVGCAM